MALSLFPPDALDRIARQQTKLHRVIDEGRWPKLYSDKPIKRTGKPLSTFDELAGRLMAEARPRRGKNGRLATDEYASIAAELDKRFVLKDELEESFRKGLKDWNQKLSQKNSQGAIHTFSKAVAHAKHRRGVHKLLNRAETKWRKCHATPQH